MSCPEDRLSAWIDGELAQRDALDVEGHVAGCRPCQELVASVHAMSRRLETEVASDAGFIVRFRERRDAISVAPWWTWRQLALRLVPLAAAVLVAALAALSVTSAPERSLQDLERDALGAPVAPVAIDNGPEAVLSIAFEPFPVDIE